MLSPWNLLFGLGTLMPFCKCDCVYGNYLGAVIVMLSTRNLLF